MKGAAADRFYGGDKNAITGNEHENAMRSAEASLTQLGPERQQFPARKIGNPYEGKNGVCNGAGGGQERGGKGLKKWREEEEGKYRWVLSSCKAFSSWNSCPSQTSVKSMVQPI